MKALVTGAAGFVGSHLIDALLQRGDPVRAYVRRENQADELRQRGVETVVGDLRNRQLLEQAVRGIEVVHHCAAAVGDDCTDAEIYAVNLEGVRNLLDAVHQVGPARVVLLSSINVLGRRDLVGATEETPCQRSNDAPANVKIDMERLALEEHRRRGLDVVILRPGFIYGPRDPRNVPRLVDLVRRGKFTFIRSRHNVTPIVHVSDVVQAMLLAAETKKASGRVYHITDGSATTTGELADCLAELLGCPPPHRVVPYFAARFACRVFGWLTRLGLWRKPPPISWPALRFLGNSRHVDIRRAREELGYQPRVPLREGLADTLRWLEESSNGDANLARSSA